MTTLRRNVGLKYRGAIAGVLVAGAFGVLFSIPVGSGSGASASAAYYYYNPAPRLLQQSVLGDLVALRATVTDKEDGHKLDEAIEHLQKSLDADLWIDDSHPQAKHSEKVFDEEKHAVDKLRELLKDKKSSIDDATLQGFIDDLVAADRMLATLAITDAPGGDVKELEKANDELAKGDAEAAEGKPGEAINHYREAWKRALKAH